MTITDDYTFGTITAFLDNMTEDDRKSFEDDFEAELRSKD